MADKPLISIIIPVYNGERYLAEAIESALGQSYEPLELIVADDGSTDGSARVVARYGQALRYLSQAHLGGGAARNLGITSARGELLAFLDADDLWMRDKLAQQHAAFASDATLDIVSGHVKHFHSPELPDEVKRKTLCPPAPRPGYLPGAMLIKRESFMRVGMFETNWRVGEAVSWYLRAMEAGLRLFMLPDTVLRRRIHETNLTLRQREALGDYVRILKASLDRRRTAKMVGQR